jgi:DNA-binding CsgD family transcriptional regulator
MPKLPGPLRLEPSFPFAGRSRELATLRSLIPDDESPEFRLALIGGEAGSGKSRLIREFAVEAADEEALVLFGACDAVVRRPYGPFVEAFEQLVRRTETGALRADLGAGAGELSRLLPDLSSRLGDLPGPTAADPDTERHRLHGAVADYLLAVSRRLRLVVAIEDCHWADTPTLHLLRHLARSASEARVLVLASFRDTEAEMPGSLSRTLADLRRTGGVTRMRLEGLSAEDVAEFLAAATDDELGTELPHLAAAMHELTGGNAFLVTELWRTLSPGDEAPDEPLGELLERGLSRLASPEGVVEVVNQRLAALDESTVAVLELAAVAGSEFGLSVLADAPGDAEPGAALEQAAAHGMIEEIHSRTIAYRFSHELVRRALYDRLTALRRAELHLRVAEALAGGAGGLPLPDPAELAHHFAGAVALDGSERAVEHSLRAAREALGTLAFDEAEAHFRTALELGVPNLREEALVRLELGQTHFRGGRSDEAMAVFLEVARAARELGDSELLATAAVGFEDACWRPGIVDAGAVELLQEASAALGDEDSELRVMLLSGLGRAHAFSGDLLASATVCDQASSMARRLDYRLGLATVLVRSYWTRGDGDLEETLAMLEEAADIACRLGETDLEAEAREWRVAGLIAVGNLADAALELADVRDLALRGRQPFTVHVAEHSASTLALCEGDLAEAEAAALRSREWALLLTGRQASATHGIQMFGIRREQGRLDEIAPAIRVLAAGDRVGAPWRPGMAALLAELELEDEARRELDRVRRDGLDSLRQSLWLASLSFLADACVAVGDRELGLEVYEELAPLAGEILAFGHGVACYGAADRHLGALAATLGEQDRAIAHLDRALQINRDMGARTWVAHTLYAYGRTLQTRDQGEDAVRAAAHLSEAADLAAAIGMPALLARARAALDDLDGTSPLPDELTQREVEVLRLVATGLSNREIGEQLFISEHTVANHVRSILRKTDASNRTDAAGYAFRNALVEPPEPR